MADLLTTDSGTAHHDHVSLTSPLTPSYCFEHDDPLAQGASEHNDHDKGSSANMRGVFLHVMAVCVFVSVG
jgi:hypothetical protein